mmetsp:Transcript_23205/g.55099  ORF Transcript_23205/g.55099 Transcript_23205/m.55099 type:complete len:241 (-) Transcript_23205:253-975(-)
MWWWLRCSCPTASSAASTALPTSCNSLLRAAKQAPTSSVSSLTCAMTSTLWMKLSALSCWHMQTISSALSWAKRARASANDFWKTAPMTGAISSEFRSELMRTSCPLLLLRTTCCSTAIITWGIDWYQRRDEARRQPKGWRRKDCEQQDKAALHQRGNTRKKCALDCRQQGVLDVVYGPGPITGCSLLGHSTKQSQHHPQNLRSCSLVREASASARSYHVPKRPASSRSPLRGSLSHPLL